MAEDREQLIVDLIARVSEFERNMRRAEGVGTGSFSKLRQESARATQGIEQDFARSTERIQQALQSTNGQMASFARGLASRLALPVSGAAVLGTLNQIKSELLAIDDLAKHTNLSIGQAAALRNVSTVAGAGPEAMATTLKQVADNLAEAAREENDFGKLLEANGIKLKDRHGQVISTNEALGHAARLIQNAANESDRIKIAEMLGVSKELIPLFARGADNLASMRSEQERSTQGLEEAVKKAKDFDAAWTAAWGNFQVASKVVLLDLGRGLSYLAEQGFNFLKGLNELRHFRVEQGHGQGIRLETPIPGITNSRGEMLPDFSPLAPRARPAAADAPPVNLGPRTIIPTSERGGRGGSGASENDTAEKRLQSYTDSIARQTAVLEAQIQTFGRSNAEKRAAEELARAAVDLNRLDAETRQTMTGKLLEQVRASETARQRLEELNKAQERTDQLTDANKEFGKSLFTAMGSGKLSVDTLTSSLDRLRNRLLDMAFDQFWDSMFPKSRGTAGAGGMFGGGGMSNILGEIFGKMFNFFPGMAAGGEVRGPGTGTSDSILRWLSNGEHVTNAESASKYRPLLEAINADSLPRMAGGGFARPALPEFVRAPTMPQLGGGGLASRPVNVTINNNAGVAVNERHDANGNLVFDIEKFKQDIEGGVAANISRGRGTAVNAIASRFGLPQNGNLIG